VKGGEGRERRGKKESERREERRGEWKDRITPL
jgi:hypothetical protein